MVVGVLLGDNIFPKRRNWHSGTNYIFLPSHFCICLEMQRRIAIVAIWNNCDRSVLSVLVVPVHQNRTHKIMHHAFKAWCIVSTNGRFAKITKRYRCTWENSGASTVSGLFEPEFFVGKHRCQMLWSGSRGDLNLRFSAFWIKYSIECHVERKIWHNSAKSIFTKFEAPVCWSWSVSKPGLFCVLNKNNSICWSYKYHWGPVPIILLMDAGTFFRFEGSCFTRKIEIINGSLPSCWYLP